MISPSNLLPLPPPAGSGSDCSDSRGTSNSADASDPQSFQAALGQAQSRTSDAANRSPLQKSSVSKAADDPATDEASASQTDTSDCNRTTDNTSDAKPLEAADTSKNSPTGGKSDDVAKDATSGDASAPVSAITTLAAITQALIYPAATLTQTEIQPQASDVARNEVTLNAAVPNLSLTAADQPFVSAVAATATPNPIQTPLISSSASMDSRAGQPLAPGVEPAASVPTTADPFLTDGRAITSAVSIRAGSTLPLPTGAGVPAQTLSNTSAPVTTVDTAAVHTVPGTETASAKTDAVLIRSEAATAATAEVRSTPAPVRPTTSQTRDHIERTYLVGENRDSSGVQTTSAGAPAVPQRPQVTAEKTFGTVGGRAETDVKAAVPVVPNAVNPDSSGAAPAASEIPFQELPVPAVNALATGPVSVGQPNPPVSGNSRENEGRSFVTQSDSQNLLPAAHSVSVAATGHDSDTRDSHSSDDTEARDATSEPSSSPVNGSFQPANGKPIEAAVAAPVNTANPGSGQADRFHVVEQVTRHLETARLANGNGELSLRLRPDHLGSLHLTITTHENGVTARIVAETTQAQQALESAKEQLRGTLAEKGMNLHALHVLLDQGAVSDGRSGFFGQQETAQERSERSANYFTGRSAPGDRNEEGALPEVSAVGRSPRPDSSTRLDYRA